MKKSDLKAMIEIDKLNDQAKRLGKSFFIINQAKYIDGRVYAVNKLFNFVEEYLEMYENAKIINMTNIFGDYRKSVSLPVYKNSKITIINRYSMAGSQFFFFFLKVKVDK